MATTLRQQEAAPAQRRERTRRRLRAAEKVQFAVLTCIMIALCGRIMSYPLQHDEQFYVPAGVLFSWSGLYEQLGFSHLPNLALLLHAIYALPIADHYLLVGRFLICAAWIGTIAAVIALGRFFGADRLLLTLMIALLVMNPLLLGPTGMAVTNNFMPVPFLLFGLFAFLKGFADGNIRWLAASGLLLAICAGFKANYALLLIPFLMTILMLPRACRLANRLRTRLLPFAAGGLLGALPTLVFLRRPDSFVTHIWAFQRGPQIAYWLAHPDANDPKVLSTRGKLALAQQLWLSGGTMALVIVLTMLTITVFSYVNSPSRAGRRAPSGLLGALLLVAVIVAFIPSPAFPQYYALPIPVGIIAVAAMAQRLDAKWRLAVRPALYAALLLTTLTGAPMLLSNPFAGFLPTRWSGLQVHADARDLAAMVPNASSDSPVATLAPIYALEGGQRILPPLALGPFVYRAVDYVSPGARQHFASALSPTNIGPALEKICPSAVLVGLEGPLDLPLERFAHDAGYVAHDFRLRGSGRRDVLLLTRGPGGACASPPPARD